MKKIKKIIKHLLFRYYSLSILKKFLLAPLLGLILVLPFYIFIFLNMLEMKQSVNSVNDELMPLQEISFNNILLLEKIVNEMNSAVSAKEVEWIDDSNKHADKIRENLNRYKESSYKREIKESITAFNNYYRTVKEVSAKIVLNDQCYTNIENDTKVLVQNYNEIDGLFKSLKLQIKNDIEKNFNSLYCNTNFILFNGNFIFSIWFFISTLIIFLVYRDIRYKINKIVEDSKEIARGDVDFEKRLCIVSYDELGQIVKSINMFINKLHKNHEELSDAKKELDTLYITDRLTNVYNRVKIDEIIDTELKKKKRYDHICSVILIDVDYFKLVNDTYGHLVGDSILKEFATLLKESVRDTDYVGRWGGEEFIIVCPQTDKNGALSLAEHLRGKIEESNFTAVGKKTASFGIATCTKEDDIQSLIDNADKALYRAKGGGRNQVVCYN
ncbi:MAG: sensor domain-containing diguanylate cyclase [Sulfurimonas sp.]|uniref:GGDEF domain-containing protein n=1 Tax=Sulfurimonas sp. TaxID=2022749 RepID=UPI002615B439|nr:sensor domain-containing diguanylate cyclase [Sulfurimonas sp.]MDD5373681.1 sensor domain-containing diguanylate cyclase [Sulfurimonas sp.]